MANEFGSGGGVIDQPTIFVTKRIVPTSDGNGDFDSVFLQRSDLFVEFVVQVGPRIVGFDDQVGAVQNGEAVNDVGANGWVNVLGFVFSDSGSIPCPIGKV